MAKFSFKLSSILNIKEKMEDLKKNEFGKAMMALEAEKARLATLQDTKSLCIQSFRDSLATGVKPDDLQQHNIYIDRLKVLIKQQKLVIIKAEEFVEVKRLELVEAMRERKTMDTLKENAYEEHLAEEKQSEQKVIDEIVSYKTATK
ncbi:MAG: flagellar export protein FliJ [Defluviitaleaceae bacterium]|nr:flagellar export protein FliJ [Defluviitaleaceae bacterium]